MKNSSRLEEKIHDSLFTEDDDRSNYMIEGAHHAIASATYSWKYANAGAPLCSARARSCGVVETVVIKLPLISKYLGVYIPNILWKYAPQLGSSDLKYLVSDSWNQFLLPCFYFSRLYNGMVCYRDLGCYEKRLFEKVMVKWVSGMPSSVKKQIVRVDKSQSRSVDFSQIYL